MTPPPASALPPLSGAHQASLRALADQLAAEGRDAALLRLLAESMPRLRAGLSPAERARIEELDQSEAALHAALGRARAALAAAAAALQGERAAPLEAAPLRTLAATMLELAEAANDLALRAESRADLLG